jgi:hypothetical protein
VNTTRVCALIRSALVVPIQPLRDLTGGIDDSDNPLRSRVDVKVPDLHGLLMATAVSVEGLH